MKIIRMVLGFLAVAGLAQAESVVLDSTSESIVANGGTQGKSIAVTGEAQAFNVGDTAKITCDLSIVGMPTYGASANWSVGFIDGNSHGAALSIRLNGNALWSASVDSSAGGSGSNTADLGAEYRESATGVQGTAFDLKSDGEGASFELNVTKTTATEYAFLATWKDSSGNVLQTFSKSDDNGVEIESINTISFGNRVTTGAVTGLLTNLVLDVTSASGPSPEDPSMIAPNHTNIVFTGSKYITASSNKVSFLRHSDETLVDPDRAFTTSKATKSTGISVSFKTDSDSILVKFSQELTEGARFSHYENDGAPVTGSYSTSTNLSFTINSAHPGTASVYRVTLPPWAQADFLGLELDDGASILPYTPPVKQTYVAIGDSITHGRGQRMTSETYPWLLAESLDLELCNLAVGGSKVSVPIAEMLSEFPPVDIVSILIGYNDLHSAGKTAVEYAADLEAMLDALRVSLPDARVACISPTYTTAETNETTGATIHEFRQVVVDQVAVRRAAGDLNIHLIRGEALTAAADLDDAVHLTIDGAANLAAGLAPIMQSILEDEAQFEYSLYGEAAQLYSNRVPYNLTNETYTFSEVYRIPAAEHFRTLNKSTSPNRSPLATRGDSTFLLVVDEGRRPQVLKIEGGVSEKGYLDKAVYQPDEFYTPPASADYYRMLDDGHHTGALGVDEEGFIHVVCDMHNYPRYATPMDHLPLRFHSKNIMYWRSDNPNDVSSFTFMGDQDTGCPQGIGFTYPYFFNDMYGKLHFTSRAHQEDTTRCAAYSAYSAAEGAWSVIGGTVPDEPDHPRLFWEDNGEGGGTYNKTHPFGIFDRDNNLHVSAPLLNTDRSPEGEILHFATDILYLTSTNGGQSFSKADGTPVSIPARAEAGSSDQADVAYTNEYLGILGNIAVDYENNPYTVAKVKYADGSDSDAYVIGWDGSSWVNYGDLANRASADFRLIHGPAGVMTLIPDSYYKIQRFWKPDGTIRTIELPWNLSNIDYEYLKQTGDFMGLTWDGDDWVIVKVEINGRPGMERIDLPEQPVSSHAPEITAGATFDGANLMVTATDADDDSLTYTWSLAYGPAAVSFVENGTEASSNTVASFTQSGTYELKVAVSDGIETRISTCTFHHVVGDPNAPRITIEASASPATLILGETAALSVGTTNTATGGRAIYTWGQSSGPGEVLFSVNSSESSSNTVASFDTIGTYELNVTISNNYGSATSTCSVVVESVPPEAANGYLEIDFSSQAFESFVKADEYNDRTGTVAVVESGAGVRFTGDLWKAFPISYQMTSDTLIEFDFYSPNEGELHALAMTDTTGQDFVTDHYEIIKLNGTDGGLFITDRDGEYSGGTNRYSIAIGQLLSLNTELKNYLDFVNADSRYETNPDAQSTFANVIIYEPADDKDGDGQSNLSEIRLGTDPEDSASMFSIHGGTVLPDLGKVRIAWPSQAGIQYRVSASPDLSAWTVVRDWSVALTPPEDVFEADLSSSNGFFKVEADIQ